MISVSLSEKFCCQNVIPSHVELSPNHQKILNCIVEFLRVIDKGMRRNENISIYEIVLGKCKGSHSLVVVGTVRIRDPLYLQ